MAHHTRLSTSVKRHLVYGFRRCAEKMSRIRRRKDNYAETPRHIYRYKKLHILNQGSTYRRRHNETNSDELNALSFDVTSQQDERLVLRRHFIARRTPTRRTPCPSTSLHSETNALSFDVTSKQDERLALRRHFTTRRTPCPSTSLHNETNVLPFDVTSQRDERLVLRRHFTARRTPCPLTSLHNETNSHETNALPSDVTSQRDERLALRRHFTARRTPCPSTSLHSETNALSFDVTSQRD